MNNKEADKTRCSNQLNRRSLIAAAMVGGTTVIAGCMGGSGEESAGQAGGADQTDGSEKTNTETSNGDSDEEAADTNEEEYNVEAEEILVYAEEIDDDLNHGEVRDPSSENNVENYESGKNIYMLDLNGLTVSNTVYVFADSETSKEEFDKAPGLTVSETVLDSNDSDIGDEAIIYTTENYENGIHVEARLANVIIGVTYNNRNEGVDLESEATSIAEQMSAKL